MKKLIGRLRSWAWWFLTEPDEPIRTMKYEGVEYEIPHQFDWVASKSIV